MRRSVAQPQSYKDFSETGHKEAIPEGSHIEQSQLMHQNNSDESRPSTAGETSNGSASEPESFTTKHDTTDDSEIMIKFTSWCKSHDEHDNQGNNGSPTRSRSRTLSSLDGHDTPGKRRRTNTNSDHTYFLG